MKVTTMIRAALGYATFSNPEVKEELENVLKHHDNDLEYVGFTPDDRTEKAMKDLETAMNSVDESQEERTATVREAAQLAREEGDDE